MQFVITLRRSWRAAHPLSSAALLSAAALLALPAAAVEADDGVDMRILGTPAEVHFRVTLPKRGARFQAAKIRGADGWVIELAARSARSDSAWPTPATDGKRVFAGGPLNSSEMFAVDFLTGRFSWRTRMNDNGPTPPVVRDRRVYVNTQSCTLYAFDTRNGHEVWSNFLASSLESVPSLADGAVVTARPKRAKNPTRDESEIPALTLVAPETGEVLADVAIDADGRGAPVVRDGAAILTTKSGAVYCVDLAEGRTRWRKEIGARGMPAVDDSGVYVAGSSAVACLDLRTGRDRYSEMAFTPSSRDTMTVRDPVRAPTVRAEAANTIDGGAFWGDGLRPTLADDKLVLAAAKTLRVFDKRTGQDLAWWELDVEGAIVGQAALARGTVVVATRLGEIRAVDLKHGEVAWAVDLGARLAGGVIVHDSRVIATTTDGRLISVHTGDLRADGWPMWGGSAAR